MRIERLEIENFRGIRKMELELHPRMNVFVGVNGAGKTTILDAAAILLSRFVGAMKEDPFFPSSPIERTDMTHGCSNTKLSIRVIADDISVLSWGRRRSSTDIPHDDELFDYRGVHRYVGELFTPTNEGLQPNVPVVILFPTDRTLPNSPQKETRGCAGKALPCIATYKDSLSNVTRFDELLQWFKEREEKEVRGLDQISHKILHQQRLEGKVPEGIDPQLEAVRKTIESFTGFESPRFASNPLNDDDPLKLTVTKDGEPFPVDQLSGGEKNLLAMTADIVRRLVIANPNRGDDYLEGHGIVMIDEIDLHMHPQWQRILLPKLRGTFPNIQFIVTTHSPQVLSHVENKAVFVLEQTDEGIVQAPLGEAYGQSYERLLEDVFGVPYRPDEVKEELGELFTRIQNNEVTAAREKLAELQALIGISDPELVRAEFLLHRKEEMTQ